jgi:hypothetical protein
MAKELTFRGVSLPSNVRWNHNGEGGLVVGAHFKTGFFAEGTVTEMREHGENVLITLDGGGQVLLFPSGMIAEVLPEAKK